MDWMTYVLGATTGLLSLAAGALVKLLFNHLEHLRADVLELRKMFIEHLRDHQKQESP